MLHAALARLALWRGEARALKPFDFYARVLGRDGGRRAMLARLGPEAADVLDEFMTLARGFEKGEAASLAGFLAILRRGGAETKRDMDSGRDEVRVMTVHGAKGLEAPIVILADTVEGPRARAAEGFLSLGAGVPILAPRKAEDPAILASARAEAAAREAEEYRRLLYVALTRAEDGLIVCGAETRVPAKDKDHARPPGCWYDLVRDALLPQAYEVSAPYAPEGVLRWRQPRTLAAAGGMPEPAASGEREPPVPLPASRGLDPGEVTPVPLRPSRILARRSRALQDPGQDLHPLVRGDLVHRLLAGLANLERPLREEAGLRMLDHAAAGLSESQHREMLDEALRLMDHPQLAMVFAPGSRAEVPVVGSWTAPDGREVAVTGRIDRLSLVADRLILADFKTDTRPALDADGVKAQYVSQLALYAAVLKRALPGRTVEAMLVYTRAPLVLRFDQSQLDAALHVLNV